MNDQVEFDEPLTGYAKQLVEDVDKAYKAWVVRRGLQNEPEHKWADKIRGRSVKQKGQQSQ